MSNDALYSPVAKDTDRDQMLYAPINDPSDKGKVIKSLADLVDEKEKGKASREVSTRMKGTKQQAEQLGAMGLQPLANRKPSKRADEPAEAIRKAVEEKLVINHEQSPSRADREKLARMAQEKAKESERGPSVSGGPTVDDRLKLAQAAMAQANQPVKAASTHPGGPSLEDRAKLMQKAMEREKEMEAAAAASAAPAASAPHRPSAEERARLAQQAMSKAETEQAPPPPSRAKMPTPEDRARLAKMAMETATHEPPFRGRAPSAADRARLAEMARHREAVEDKEEDD